MNFGNDLKLFAALAMLTGGFMGASAEDQKEMPGITGQVTFLYYDDLEAPARFYGELLGLERTLDLGWTHIYRVSGTASVGIVGDGRGYHAPSDDKPVMLSIVTDDLAGWYAHLKAQGVTFLSEPHSETEGVSETANGGAPVQSLLIQDPGGYTVEFFEWQ